MSTVPASPISLVIIDTVAIASDLLKHAFHKQPGYRVLGCAKSIEAAIRLVSDQRPDIAIISASENNSALTVLQLLDEFSSIGLDVRTIVLSPQITPQEAATYLRAQARGVVSGMDIEFPVLCKCVDSVHRGQVWANSEQLLCLIQSYSNSRNPEVVNADGQALLSVREQQVIDLLVEGLSNRELAAALELSEHTIKNHLFHIFDKLGVSSRMEAAVYAINHRKHAKRSDPHPSSLQQVRPPYRHGVRAVNE